LTLVAVISGDLIGETSSATLTRLHTIAQNRRLPSRQHTTT
jgi:hypothetical protein